MTEMPIFDIRFRIEPAHVLGIRTSSMEVAPVNHPPKLVFDPVTFEQSVTRPDETPGERRPEEMVRANFSLEGITFVWTDTICLTTLEALDLESAVDRAERLLKRILRLLMGSTTGVGALLTPHVVDVSVGGRALSHMVSSWQRFYIYDNERFTENLLAAVELTRQVPPDLRLDRALMYLGIGDAMDELFSADSPDDHLVETLPIRFLQYWKALTVIVGDASRDSDHQKRPRSLGLGREFFRQRVRPLNELRDRSDVAHSINPRDARAVTSEQVTECREVATAVIHAYCQTLLQGQQARGN